MKYLLIILIPLIYGCQNTTAQKIDSSIEEDRKFEQLLNKVETNTKISLQAQVEASKEQTKIVEQTVSKITTLKAEVKTLKEENNAFKVKIDSNTAVGKPFKLLPVSNDQNNR
jgi:hypothetical protein